ncbi:MAG: glutamate mutase L [Acholeplasmataceae bacterium]
MKIDCLVAEIGSTTTIVNAFNLKKQPTFLGRGMAQTTVEADVNLGLREAIEDLKNNLGVKQITYDELFASSSAAGGLRLTVHGLVYEMTARAAKEAALNAGANIHFLTANLLEDDQIEKIKSVDPNIVIIAGGTNYGEKETAYQNLLKVIPLNKPIIYTGNIANHDRIKKLSNPSIKIVDNVYPRVDDFNILPLREAIYETFSENIIHAKGMSDVKKMVQGNIIPTPGAVMDATLLCAEMINGVMTIDVGGATTDIHSVSEPKPVYAKFNEGEPKFKRTVEGDLGIYVNREYVVKSFRKDELENKLNLTAEEIDELIKKEPFIPQSKPGKKLMYALTKQCVEQALNRHIGDLKRVYTTNGLKVIPEGRDTSQVKIVCLTGGALLYMDNAEKIVTDYFFKQQTKLIPDSQVLILKDHDYIFASIGVLSHVYKEEAKILLKKTLRWEG